MSEFKIYMHAFLILALGGIGLTLLWTLWPVILAVSIGLGVMGTIWALVKIFGQRIS